MSEETKTSQGLIYGIEDRPPFHHALFAAIQHLLAILVAIVTPPLIIAKALNLDLSTTSFIISMSFFASGLSTFIQCKKFGFVGCGLLCVQGTSFSFISPIISIGLVGGLPLVFGACIFAAPVEILVSFTFKYLRKIITPLVSGIVVMLIGSASSRPALHRAAEATSQPLTSEAHATCSSRQWYSCASFSSTHATTNTYA